MSPDLDTLATALYTRIDDLLLAHPEWAPQRPAAGIAPKLSDAELITLAVIQVLLRFRFRGAFHPLRQKQPDTLVPAHTAAPRAQQAPTPSGRGDAARHRRAGA